MTQKDFQTKTLQNSSKSVKSFQKVFASAPKSNYNRIKSAAINSSTNSRYVIRRLDSNGMHISQGKRNTIISKKQLLNQEITPFDKLKAIPQKQAPSYFPPQQRKNIKTFLMKDSIRIGNSHHSEDTNPPIAINRSSNNSSQDIINSKQNKKVFQQKLKRDSVVLGLDKSSMKQSTGFHYKQNYNQNSSTPAKLEKSKNQEASIASNLRQSLRKHSFKFGSWNKNKLSQSYDTTSNSQALKMFRLKQAQKLNSKGKQDSSFSPKQQAIRVKLEQRKSHIPTKSNNTSPQKQYKTQNVETFSDVRMPKPEDCQIGKFKINRVIQQKSNILLGSEPRKLSKTLKFQESINKTPQRRVQNIRQFNQSGSVSRKSLELTSIYGNRVSATNLLPRGGDNYQLKAFENLNNTITPNVKSDNVNYRSVITDQWIKQRKAQPVGSYNNIIQDIPTTSQDFYSKIQPVPLQIRVKDKLIAKEMKKNHLRFSANSNSIVKPKDKITNNPYIEKSIKAYDINQTPKEAYLKSIDQEYIQKSIHQRINCQKDNSNFEKHPLFPVRDQQSQSESFYNNKYFTSKSQDSLSQNKKINDELQKQLAQRQRSTQFKFGLRESQNFPRVNSHNKETETIISSNGFKQRAANRLKNRRVHMANVDRTGLEPKLFSPATFDLANQSSIGLCHENYKTMMRSDFSKFSGGVLSPQMASRNMKSSAQNTSQTVNRIGSDSNFNQSQKLRSQAGIIKNASLKSQIIFGVQKARPESIKRNDESYNTSYSMLYKWKSPIPFDG